MLQRQIWQKSRLISRVGGVRKMTTTRNQKEKMVKILSTEPVDEICAQIFQTNKFQLDQLSPQTNWADYRGLICRSQTKIDETLLKKAANLRLIGRAGSGLDNVDLSAASANGVLVLNAPMANSISTAELTMGLMTTLAHSLHQKQPITDNVNQARLLHGKTLGIVGLGRVGREVASRSRSFGMSVLGFDPIVSDSILKSELNVEPVSSMEEIFRRCDYISLHLPYNNSTPSAGTPLIDYELLSKCKDSGVYLINTARSQLIDFHDMKRILIEQPNKIKGLAFDSTLKNMEETNDDKKFVMHHDKTIVTPHVGALTGDAQYNVGKQIATQMSSLFQCESIQDIDPEINIVNKPVFPNASNNCENSSAYLSLAEQLGSLQAQFLLNSNNNNKLQRLIVSSEGFKSGECQLEDILCGVLKGLLSPHFLEESVTLENAKAIAERMGIQCETHDHFYPVNNDDSTNAVTNYNNLIHVTCEYSKTTKVHGESSPKSYRHMRGTVVPLSSGEKKTQSRLVGFNEFQMDLVLDRIDSTKGNNLLFFRNLDQPGVLSSLLSVLAANHINIGSFELGRNQAKKQAIGCLSLDQQISKSLHQQLEELEWVEEFCPVFLANQNSANPSGFRLLQDWEPLYRISPPSQKPRNPNFGSGPCRKRPGYDLSKLDKSTLGRSHRSKLGAGKLKLAIDKTRALLNIPTDYEIGIVPGSDTGAMEMAMWNVCGAKPIDVMHWENFGSNWATDVVEVLGLSQNTRVFSAEKYGEMPVDWEKHMRNTEDNDIIFAYNGTTSGVKLPHTNWISNDRTGLILNDATSAVFAMDMDWSKFDITTFSWQKVLGGEAGQGMIVLSPRAIHRMETFIPANRPIPRLFTLTKPSSSTSTKRTLNRGIFRGSTINTPSMMCVEDYLDALEWCEEKGGLQSLIKKSQQNLKVWTAFCSENQWLQFLVEDEKIRSNTSVCFVFPDLSSEEVDSLKSLLEKERVAFDIGSYRSAPKGIRIWCGATVEENDLVLLSQWLKWAYKEVVASRNS